VHRFGCQHARLGHPAVCIHHVAHQCAVHVHLAVERASQVAVGKHANHALIFVHYRGHAEPLAAHLDQARAQWRRRTNHRQVVAPAHDVFDVHQQTTSEGATRVGTRKIFRRESARLEDGDSERIAHGQRGRGAGGRRKIQRTRFGRYAHVESNRRIARQGRAALATQCDQRHIEPLDDRQDRQQFVGLAGIGKGQNHVLDGDHADVAVDGLGRVQEKSGAAGAGERRRDLVADVPRFPHARDDDTALTSQQQFASPRE